MKTIFLSLILLIVFGQNSTSAQVSVVNQKGTITAVDSSKWTLSGSNIYNKNSGNVGLGNPSPTYKLDVTGKARITDSLVANTGRIIVLNSGTTNDSMVVADPSTGVLKRISPRADSTTASNGLTLSTKDVKLGGSLTGATTITTSSTNTLAISGLQSGAASDSLVTTVGASGILRRVEQNRPVVIKTTTTQASTVVTPATINTLTFNTVAGKNYRVRLWLVYNAAATTTGIILGPSTFSGGNYWYSVFINASATVASSIQQISGFNTGTTITSTSSRATTGNVALIEMNIEATSAAAVSFQFASEVAGSAITIQANSFLEYEVTN